MKAFPNPPATASGLHLIAWFLLLGALAGTAAEPKVLWSASRIHGSPEPPLPVIAERVLPKVSFKDPVDLASTPSLSQLFVVELAGKISSLTPSDADSRPEQVADLRKIHPNLGSAYGLVFHPGFATNRFAFVCYTVTGDSKNGSRVSRFRMPEDDPARFDAESEQIVITWPEGGHNGGCIKFGADGMLYISTGDSASPSPPDPLNTGQDISDLLSSILRIDVDHTEPALAYRIPADNPFLKILGARGEVWAYGLRNPWKMSFEPGTSTLWVGDVGWELWEMIFRLDHGGINCGWSIIESRQPVKPDGHRGPTAIQKPIVDQSHDEAASITAGLFYRGGRLPEYRGHYLYGDWETGKIWALRETNGVLISHREIADTPLKIVSFGETRDGELYLLDYTGGGLFWLAHNPAANQPGTFPRRLSETGLFASLSDETPAPGVYEFEVNAPLWTDGAKARRWVASPSAQPIRFPSEYWLAPRDLVASETVFARTVYLQGGRQTTRRMETQVLHYNADSWNAYTYRWNREQTDADLVSAEGSEEILPPSEEPEGANSPPQRWRYHSRSECLRCHNPWNGSSLSFNSVQLKRSVAIASKPPDKHSLEGLLAIGSLELPPKPDVAAVDPSDPSQTLESRSRAYLHANCAHCHREAAGGSVRVLFNHQIPTADMRLIGVTPIQGSLGIADAKLVVAGDPLRSVLMYRFAKAGSGHMPYVGTTLVDDSALDLLSRWIESLPAPADRIEPAALLKEARALFGQPASPAELDRRLLPLLETPQGALAVRIALAGKRVDSEARQRIIRVGVNTSQPLMRDLLTPLLPASARRETVGPAPDIARILAQPGDGMRGKRLFFAEAGLQCHTCHQIEGLGRDLGPELTRIGAKYSVIELLQQILNPSAKIEPQFAAWIVETKGGESLSGYLREQTADLVVLRDSLGAEHRLAASEIKSMSRSAYSLMPEGLLQNSTVQEAADLLAYLVSRR